MYDEGFKRLGCIGCPIAYWRQREREFKRFPHYYRAYLRTFKKMLQLRKESNMKDLGWKNELDVMDFFLYGAEKTYNKDQLTFNFL